MKEPISPPKVLKDLFSPKDNELVLHEVGENHEVSTSTPIETKSTRSFLPICPSLGGQSYPIFVPVGGNMCPVEFVKVPTSWPKHHHHKKEIFERTNFAISSFKCFFFMMVVFRPACAHLNEFYRIPVTSYLLPVQIPGRTNIFQH